MKFTEDDIKHIERSLKDVPSHCSRDITINGITLPWSPQFGTDLSFMEKVYTRAERIASTDLSNIPEWPIHDFKHLGIHLKEIVGDRQTPTFIQMNGHRVYVFEDDTSNDIHTIMTLSELMFRKKHIAEYPEWNNIHFEEIPRINV